MKKQSFSRSKGLVRRKELARSILLAYGVTLGVGLTTGGAALAQDAAPAAEKVGIQSVTVTARKVNEQLQDIPMTVTAFSAEALENQHIQRINDLNNLAPGLNFQDGTGRGGAGKFLVRGLTSGVSGQARASVFLDGVYVGNSVSNLMFGEMERVEVVLGPQSTQFGRSTFGGAINYITKEPKNATHGEISVSRASLGEKTLDAYISGSLTDDHSLLGSLYVGYDHFDGPGAWRNPADVLHPDGYQMGSTDTKSISGKLIWKATRDLRFTGRVSYTKDHDSPANPFVLSPQYRTTAYNQVRNGVSQPAYYFSGVVNPPGAYSGSYVNNGQNLDQQADPDYRNHTVRATLITDYALGENSLKLTLSDNFENTTHGNYADADATNFPSSNFVPNLNTVRDKSAELRFDSDQHQKLRYSTGLYYLNLKSTQDASTYSSYACATVCVPTSAAALYNTALLTGYTGTVSGSLNRGIYPYNLRTGVRDKSVFGGVFYDFTDKWTASLEGRYQQEDVLNLNVSAPASPIGGTVRFNSFLPRANIQYKISPQSQVFAVASRGNNPGGINTATQIGHANTGTDASMREIKEETLNNFELGYKSSWLNNTVVFNASYYHMIWKDMQSNATYYDPLSGIFSLTQNRGEAKIDGIGLEAEWLASEDLTFNGQVSANNARYTKFCSAQLANLYYGPASSANPLAGGDASCLAQFNIRGVNVAGNKLETSPAKTASIGFDFHQPLVDGWKWYSRGGMQYSDGQWESEANLAKSPNAKIYNLAFGLQRKGWTYEVSCRNCSDEDSPTRFTRLTDVRTATTSSLAGGLGYNQSIGGTLRRPRQYGVNASYKF